MATFTDVVTGRRDDRKDYRRMVDYAKQGGADVIVVQFLDRFGRNPREILQRYWELEEHGVSAVPTDEDIKGEFVLLIRAGIAGAESRRTSERMRANMGRVVSKGVHVGRPPYGLRSIKKVVDDKVVMHWELDPEEAPVVREMRRLAIEENLGYKAIADRLTDMGYKARGGRPFAAFTVQRVLANPAIMGTLIFGRRPRKGNPAMDLVEKPDFFPAILSKEEWDELQQRFSIRRENPRGKAQVSEYLLSGVAKCGHCGGPMTGKVGALRKGKRYQNYYCSWAMKSKALCAYYNGHSTTKLEKAIIEYLGQFSDPDLVREYMSAVDEKELKTREKELKEVERRLRDIDSSFMVRLDDLLRRNIISEDEFVQANQKARDEKAALGHRKSELEEFIEKERNRSAMVENLPQLITSFLEAFESLDIRQQKVHLQSILKAAHVYRDGRIELELR